MPKLHLLLKKEEINPEKINNEKIAIVFDVLLATSTITTVLQYGATSVLPVINRETALKKAETLDESNYLLAGEWKGKPLPNFHLPSPLVLKELCKNKTVILSTTNGTVAIDACKQAKEVYVASILNSEAVAKHVCLLHPTEAIVVVCSGSSNQFCLEDFYGAGYFFDLLLRETTSTYELTDAALSALLFYQNVSKNVSGLLNISRVGKMIRNYGGNEDVQFVSQKSIFSTVPVLTKNESIQCYSNTSISHKR